MFPDVRDVKGEAAAARDAADAWKRRAPQERSGRLRPIQPTDYLIGEPSDRAVAWRDTVLKAPLWINRRSDGLIRTPVS